MSRRSPSALGDTAALVSLGDWLEHAIALYNRHGVAVGQVASNPHDEALYLLLRTLDLPLDSDPGVLRRKLTRPQVAAVTRVLTARIIERTPAAYLTKEAYLGPHRFYVDERVIIPRSYFLELIPEELERWMPQRGAVAQVVDVCTGSGCLAILLAHHFPRADVDAIDLSPEALQVAAINVAEHGLKKRVRLHQSDVFDSVPRKQYDIILSNPPYEPSAHVDGLPEEFHREPRMALDGGKDGLDIIRKLLLQARDRLTPKGIVVIEVGGLREAMDREFASLGLKWLHTADGSDCVCLIQASKLGVKSPNPRR